MVAGWTWKTYGARVFPTAVCGTDCSYLDPLISLKKLAVAGKSPTDNGDECTGIQKGLHWVWCRIFKADSTSSLNKVTRIHYYDVNAWAWISLVERVPIELNAGHAMRQNILAR